MFENFSNKRSMMKKHLKNCILWGLKSPRALNLTKKLRKGAVALYYHGIENEIIDPRIQEVHMTLKNFEKNINYLQKNFEIVSLDYIHDCLRSGHKIGPNQILITFDDGYKNNIKIVAPFLKSYDIPFTVFICTNHITNGSRLPTYYLRASIFYTEHKYIKIDSIEQEFDISTPEKCHVAKDIIERRLKTSPQHKVNLIVKDLINLIPQDRWSHINDIFSSDELMSWDDIKILYDLGVTIGSHCHDHFILHANQNKTETNNQLRISKELIEEKLGKCRYIAYPDGRENNISIDSLVNVKKNKYDLGFTICGGEIKNDSNPYLLPRVGTSENLEYFKFNIDTIFLRNRKLHKWISKLNQRMIDI